MARRPTVKPTVSEIGFVLLMRATGCRSVGIPVTDVVGVLESSIDVSVSRRTLFDQRKREGELVIGCSATLPPHSTDDLPAEIQIKSICNIVVQCEGYSVLARTKSRI